MRPFTLTRNQVLPISLATAWDFFSNPRNLATITPPWLDFKVISPIGDKVENGQHIQYHVKPILGITMLWESVIQDVNQPFSFVDQQVKGPYAYWHHRHMFTEVPGGVNIEDLVTYALPLGFLGDIIHPTIIMPRLEAIFNYRYQTLEKLFPKQ